MSELNKELAKITDFKLNIQERGILMFHLFVSYESGFSQGVGGLVLDDYIKNPNYDPSDEKSSRGERVGTAYGCEMIRQLMLTLEVDDFSDAKNKLIYILGEGEAFSFKPLGIQTLSVYGKVKTLIFSDVLDKFKLENKGG